MQDLKQHKIYYPLLDTTRFIAFIPVFLTHCFITNNIALLQSDWYPKIIHFLNVGLLGLDYFFVLSSFLITRLIIEEWTQLKTFDFRLFFIRRSLRIWPLYFLMILIGFSIYFLGWAHGTVPPLMPFITFTLNLFIAENGFEFLFFLVFLWSISVEEQFYIFWGICLLITSKISSNMFKYSIPAIALALIIISIIYRSLNFNDELKLYFHTLSVTANFGTGIVLGYLSAFNKGFVSKINSLKPISIIILAGVLAFSVGCYTLIFTSHWFVIFERLYFSVLFALVIAVLCHSSYISGFQKLFHRFDYLGKISLGLYFYHGIIITIFSKLILNFPMADKPWQVMLLNPLLMLILSIICASISYNYFEKPILAFKNNFYRISEIKHD